jgi:hypothetical protein
MKQKYKYEIDTTLDHNPNKPLYRLKTTKAGKEITKVIGIGALRTMYNNGTICGHIPPYLKEKIGAPRRKTRSDKGLAKGIGLARKWALNDLIIDQFAPVKSNWAIPEEFKVEPVKALNIAIKSYCYCDANGRWHVIMCDGIEDEDTYPTEKWALQMVDMYNNSSPETEEIS